jgi:hypothetical protein
MRNETSDIRHDASTDNEARAQRLRRLAKKRGLILTLLTAGYVLVPANATMTLDEAEAILTSQKLNTTDISAF